MNCEDALCPLSWQESLVKARFQDYDWYGDDDGHHVVDDDCDDGDDDGGGHDHRHGRDDHCLLGEVEVLKKKEVLCAAGRYRVK